MNNRIFSVVLFTTLLTVSSGCCNCNMGKMFFGRGARCGLCRGGTAAVAPPATYAAPQPYMQPVASVPVQQVPVQQVPVQQAPMQTPAPMQAVAPYQGQVTYQGQSSCCSPMPCQGMPCQSMPCQSQPAPQPPRKSCFLKDWFSHKRQPAPQQYAPTMAYQNAPCYSCYGSESMGGCGCGTTTMGVDPYTMQSGQVIENGTVIQGDGFSARRFDTDGAQIIWEQPSS
ncbi:hypothetical protein N9D23_08765 [Rubripirellula sp.]|nr:hypothetical protein [Rubripirellula sp.]